ncbi:hypothetical protein [Methylibium sp.]|uniref:hypothetical protein n=1 Tax=Methylibium sp. TaxID=2067992 RepID=UPI003D0AB3E2
MPALGAMVAVRGRGDIEGTPLTEAFMLSFNFSTRLFSRSPSALDAVRARRAARDETDLAELEEGLPACGWFDSSYELHRGLAVTEHGGLEDDAAVALAVSIWLH